ncbi:MAG: T9SS type A sorting domain-containing protein [Bacteroidia bacterium]|nr:T9SS type A sorting domain-containing protein [Bacteroidia bacterium]
MKNKLLPFAFLLLSAAIAEAQPVTAAAGSDVTICAGSTTPLNGIAVFGTPPYTYLWAPTTGLSNPNVPNPGANPSTTTIYTLTVTDAVFANSSDAVQVTVLPLPTVSCSSNSPVCEGQTINILSTTNASSPSYAWTGPSGFTDTNQNPNVTGFMPWAGMYNLTLTDLATGCVNVGNTNVIINAAPVITVNSPSMCVGGSAALTAAGANSYNWSPSGELSASFGVNVTAFCVATTTINVTGIDALGCQSLSPATATVTVLPPPSLVANSAAGCYGLFDTLTASGAVTYVWSGPNGYSAFTTNAVIGPITPAELGTYTVTGTDANGCTATYTASLNANPNTDISGVLTYSLGAVNGADVFLITQGSSSALYDTLFATLTNASGAYTFTGVNAGNYYVRTESTLSPSFVNTYYGNQYLWDSALVVVHGCTQIDSANVAMLEMPALSGSANISGTIYEGVGFGQKLILGPVGVMTNVIPGVPVKVGKNPGGAIVASTLTDAGGVFTFNNLPIDNYRIYTDIPGYPMDSSYALSITGSETVVNLDYYVDSNSVYIDLTTKSPKAIQNEINFKVFPNPTNGKITIQFANENKNETICLYDLGGRLIYSSTQNSLQNNYLQLDLNGLEISSGVYLLQLQNSGKKFKINFMRN